MSRADPVSTARGQARFLGSELLMVFRRRRNLALLVVLGAVPVLIAVAVKLSGHHDHNDSIFGGITDNGLFAALAAFLVVVPLFLPLGVAVVAGDAIAGEANTGTLRYLLAVPVARSRLLAVKFAGILVWCAASVVVVAACGTIAGAILFPSGELTLLSGRTVSYAAGGYRLLLVAGYVALSMAMVGALGLFVSTHDRGAGRSDGGDADAHDRERGARRGAADLGHPPVAAVALLAAMGRPAARPDGHQRRRARLGRLGRLHRRLPQPGLGPLHRQGRHELSHCR